jgi:carboxyl-terminal processing protease
MPLFSRPCRLSSRILLAAALPLAAAALCHAEGNSADEPAQQRAMDGDAFARRALAATDLVLEQHIDPPTRQEMVLRTAQALLAKSNQPIPHELSRRLSDLSPDGLRQLLCEVWNAARASGNASDEEFEAAALEGMLATVPAGQFVPARAHRVEEQVRANRYVGIGIALGIDDADKRHPMIMSVFPRGPARLADAKPGDLILDVDGVSTGGVRLDKVIEMLRGDEGTPVTLLVRHSKSEETRTLAMTRGPVPFESLVGVRRLADDTWDFHVNDSEPIAYVRMEMIGISTLHELRQVARTLETQGFRAMVLDLRGSGVQGGFEYPVLVADELLDDGVIGRLRQPGREATVYRARPDSLLKGWPLVVLVSPYTRGEAEFLAAALQDNHRAILVGERTAGDAYVRTAVELSDGMGAIVLRTGVMERGDGRALVRPGRADDRRGPDAAAPPADPRADWGVQPDEAVAMDREQLTAWYRWRRERDRAEAASTAPADPPLDKALELLRTRLSDSRGM